MDNCPNFDIKDAILQADCNLSDKCTDLSD